MIESSLIVAHNIFVTDEHREILKNGDDVQVIGVSCPVWTHKGQSSEPGVEVFNVYNLFIGDSLGIKLRNRAYEITMPKDSHSPRVSDDVWNSLSPEQQEIWYATNQPTPSLRNLLDFKEGGSRWLAFRQTTTIRRKKRLLYLVHFVEIKDMSLLMETLITP